MKNKTKRYGCYKCDERFISWQQRNRHLEDDHKPPMKTTIEMKRYGEYHKLIGGVHMEIGDLISFEKKGVITKITKTENSRDVEVEVAVISDVYNQND